MQRHPHQQLIDRLGRDARELFEGRAAVHETEADLPREVTESLALLAALMREPAALLGVAVLEVELDGDPRCTLVADWRAVRLRLLCEANRGAGLGAIVAGRFGGAAVAAAPMNRGTPTTLSEGPSPAHAKGDRMKGKPRKAQADTVPKVQVLKSAQCKSLSGRSTLGYEVGAKPDGAIHLRIGSNTGSGCFNREWTPLRELQRELARAPGPVNSGTLNRVFAGRSQNTSGFVAAALLGEGLLEPLSNARGYARTDGVAFMKEARRLLDGGMAQVAAPARKADAAMPSEKKAKAPPEAKVKRQ